jgi:hypothetical protein
MQWPSWGITLIACQFSDVQTQWLTVPPLLGGCLLVLASQRLLWCTLESPNEDAHIPHQQASESINHGLIRGVAAEQPSGMSHSLSVNMKNDSKGEKQDAERSSSIMMGFKNRTCYWDYITLSGRLSLRSMNTQNWHWARSLHLILPCMLCMGRAIWCS